MRNLMTGVATAAIALGVSGAALAGGTAGDLPPNAELGHCYGKVMIPERYETYTEQVVQTPGRTETRIIPAVTRTVEKQEIATEARDWSETIPATYRDVTETVVVRPASTRVIEIPPVYETVSEQVMVRPAYSVWKRQPAPRDVVVPGSPYVMPTGEVVCLVEIPAEYRTVTRQVLVRPASTREETIPAEYRTVSRRVVDQPARTVEHHVPATYRTVHVTEVVTPERSETIVTPPTYATVTKQRRVSERRYEWREVVCTPEAGPTPPPRHYRGAEEDHRGADYPRVHTESRAGGDTTVRAMQHALQDKGYYHGPVDGLFSPETRDAMVRFQHDQHLAEGQLTPETAGALGLH